MRFSVYQPPQATERPVPVLFYLAGLTCTEETFMKALTLRRHAGYDHGYYFISTFIEDHLAFHHQTLNA